MLRKVAALGPLGGHKVQKSVKLCSMAVPAMLRSHRGTGVSPVTDWVICGYSLSLVPLAGRQVQKLVKFRTTAMVVRVAVESLRPPINADERGCSPVSSTCIGVHRRFPSRRYEARSLSLVCLTMLALLPPLAAF